MQPFNSSNPARLDRRATLLYPEAARDAAGGEVVTWIESGTVWADWNPTPGREIQQAGQKLALTTGILRIRWRSAISATWRVLLGHVTFELAAPPVEIGRRVYLEIALRAISGSPPASVTARLLHDGSTRRLHDDSIALLHAA